MSSFRSRAPPPPPPTLRPPAHSSQPNTRTPTSASTPLPPAPPPRPSTGSRPPRPPPPPQTRSALTLRIRNYHPLPRPPSAPDPGAHHQTSLDFSDAGWHLASTSSARELQLYDVRTGACVLTVKCQKFGCDLACFAMGAYGLPAPGTVSGSGPTGERGKASAPAQAPGPGSGLSVLHTSTLGEPIVRHLDLAHGGQYVNYYSGHTRPVRTLVRFPKEDLFLSASRDSVHLWDLRQRVHTVRMRFEGKAFLRGAVDPSGLVFALGDAADGVLGLWDRRFAHRKPFAVWDVKERVQGGGMHWGTEEGGAGWSRVEFGNDGRLLLVAGEGDRASVLLDAAGGELLGSLALPKGVVLREKAGRRSTGDYGDAKSKALGEPPTSSGSITFAPDGRHLIGGSGSKDIYVWDTASIQPPDGSQTPDSGVQAHRPLEPVKRLEGSQSAGAVVTFNPRLHAFATADREVMIWSPESETAVP